MSTAGSVSYSTDVHATPVVPSLVAATKTSEGNWHTSMGRSIVLDAVKTLYDAILPLVRRIAPAIDLIIHNDMAISTG
ncbi:hypothetical protein SDRG_15796 [Saprolegnia diclina VS20]|uniref:Uncharacterized protein n=1 Tax=Saprolegnia diclina (strain VS20) TaxID=1156394 RepID=T0PZ68_SAPDV|nr:hypothetical protein SDRG_15796 [Saprolegnia diclina VS20]EQC26385.1 hypothetical protein SDRG_15796 [Saprolegnia diclina VS20]|eukprot:XP_008620200.1 hypothetical protein SDRG_15796 [Saprolegnia diclina VS20]